MKEAFDSGVCPICKKTDGYVNVSSAHFFIAVSIKRNGSLAGTCFPNGVTKPKNSRNRYTTKLVLVHSSVSSRRSLNLSRRSL
jgi:hypothetical protein